MKKVASLQYGVVFKKAFCDPEIFAAFAQRARMIEENHQEELRQTKFEEGMKEATRRIAERMLRQGIAPELIAEAAGLSAAELAELADGLQLRLLPDR
jgi:predicted transposase/invertase (TIGR01784 family)